MEWKLCLIILFVIFHFLGFSPFIVCFQQAEGMEYKLKNVHVAKALELGSQKGAEQLFFAKKRDGSWEVCGELNKKEVMKFLQEGDITEEAKKMEWLTPGAEDFPKLEKPLAEILKTATKVKTAVAAALNYIMKLTNTKLGRGDFLAWHYPMEKDFMVYTGDLIEDLPNPFTLSMIINWSELQGVRISNGRVSALKLESGVKSWLSACKIFLDFFFVAMEHNPARWVEVQDSGVTVQQRAKRIAATVPLLASTKNKAAKETMAKPAPTARYDGIPDGWMTNPPCPSSPPPRKRSPRRPRPSRRRRPGMMVFLVAGGLTLLSPGPWPASR